MDRGGEGLGWGEAIAPLTSPQSFTGPSSLCFKFYIAPQFSQKVQFSPLECNFSQFGVNQ